MVIDKKRTARERERLIGVGQKWEGLSRVKGKQKRRKRKKEGKNEVFLWCKSHQSVIRYFASLGPCDRRPFF